MSKQQAEGSACHYLMDSDWLRSCGRVSSGATGTQAYPLPMFNNRAEPDERPGSRKERLEWVSSTEEWQMVCAVGRAKARVSTKATAMLMAVETQAALSGPPFE